MRISSTSAIGISYFAALTLGCGGQPEGGADGSAGTLRAAIEIGASTHDVTEVRFDIVASDGGCDATPIGSQTVGLQAERAPPSGSGELGPHHFASSLFTLPPGDYRACATPLRSDLTASAECGQASDTTTVTTEQSLELTLVSQCAGTASGGAEVAVTLNDPPAITGVTVTDSTYVTVCESAKIAVTAEDPNADAMTYDWSIVAGPDGGHLTATDQNATFSGQVGDYVLRVTATDAHAAQTSFSFTMHVADATCVVPAEVQAIFVGNCAPCHTTGSSGGLKLDPADVAYTSLVGHGVGAAACSSRTRALPGDAENSYIIAKLRNTAGICGQPMPRGKPALPEEQIQAIEAWIDALPH